jgi:CheY-like chemotaxis protein
MNILIVDDIATNRKLLCAILKAEGHRTVEAADGADALGVLKREEVDAIISDILMPRMDGYRFCYEVRASECFRQRTDPVRKRARKGEQVQSRGPPCRLGFWHGARGTPSLFHIARQRGN